MEKIELAERITLTGDAGAKIVISNDRIEFYPNGMLKLAFTSEGEFIDYGCPCCRALRRKAGSISCSLAELELKVIHAARCSMCGGIILQKKTDNHA